MEKEGEAFLELVSDSNFCALLKLHQRAAITWDEFLNQPLPHQLSPRTTWAILNMLSKSTGIIIDISDTDSNGVWYRRTDQLVELIEEIQTMASEGSRVHTVITKDVDDLSLHELRIDEIVGAFNLAGIDLPADKINEVLSQERKPQNDKEQLALNMLDVDEHLMMYKDEDFSYSLFNKLLHQLARNICLDEFGDLPKSLHNKRPECAECSFHILHNKDEQPNIFDTVLPKIIDYANRCNCDDYDSIVLQGSFLADIITYIKPYGDLSALVGSLITRLFYLKHNYEVLAIAPLSKMKSTWIHNTSPIPDLCCTTQGYQTTIENNIGDYTIHQTISAQLIIASLKEIEVETTLDCDTEELISHIIDTNHKLNNRQRSILSRATRTPNAEFRISYHQKKNNISYATARRDLVSLVQQGYLKEKYSGRNLIFLSNSLNNEFIIQNAS